MNRRTFLTAAGAAASGAVAASGAPKRPNIIVLFTDDMGYGDLACYGNPVIRTPNLDRMAEEGARFTSFYAAAPVCTPSRVGLLTGRYPVRAGQPNNTGPDTKGGLPLTEVLLPQILKPLGYRTAAIGKWHLGYKPAEYLPTARGFDSYFGLPYSNDMIPPWVKTQQPLELYRDAKPMEEMKDQSNLTERYTEEALRVIRGAGKNPFFLYLPFAMPHMPISASSRKGKSRAGLYGDVIETIDWSVGEILGQLKRQGIDKNTLVVFASDNGPWIGAPPRMMQKGNEPWHAGTKSLLRGSKGSTWEGGQRVPGIIRWPGVIPARQTIADMASTLDVFPTVAAATGAAMPSGRTFDGFDLLPMLQGKAKPPRETFFYFRGRSLEAVREGSWKFRFGPDSVEEGVPPRPAAARLYNLDIDPAEDYDMLAREPEVAARLRSKLLTFGQELKADLPREPGR